jgi:hypothetical protein
VVVVFDGDGDGDGDGDVAVGDRPGASEGNRKTTPMLSFHGLDMECGIDFSVEARRSNMPPNFRPRRGELRGCVGDAHGQVAVAVHAHDHAGDRVNVNVMRAL